MSAIFGLSAGAVVSWLTFLLASPAFDNAGGAVPVLGLVLIAGLLTFLAGAAAFRRAKRTHERLALFSALAFSVSLAIVGAAFMVALTASYTTTFSVPGSGNPLLDAIAYPILAALGASMGGLAGWIVGLVSSGALRLVAPASR